VTHSFCAITELLCIVVSDEDNVRNREQVTYRILRKFWVSVIIWCAACFRLIVCVHIAEMTKWSTQRYRRDRRMKDRPCFTCVQSAGLFSALFILLTD